MIPEENMDKRWKIFSSKSIPKDFTQVQVGLFELAFLSGGMNLFSLLHATDDDEVKKQTIVHLQNLHTGALAALQILMEGRRHDQAHEQLLREIAQKVTTQSEEPDQFVLPLEQAQPPVSPEDEEPPTAETFPVK